MQINYDLIRSFHAVDAILNNEETARRLREVETTTYTHNPRIRSILRTLGRKAGMNSVERAALADFPEMGINIENYSNALLFAPALCLMSTSRHASIVSLMKQGKLAIVEGYRIDSNPPRSRMNQVIVKVEA